ncbi:MAG: pilus assembly protein PilM [Alicyclobacillus macrosporangiidus]|uniref:type IV pilus biogenesis protein PilM n=1 Tax=Alicyclobacillus macrosporangiidus TaxID=392015 RepID=UPI0026F00497|nr:pilus assembly protein PilM [Alicyclobacillus macrosporangiidus]MCL6600095.1 pilus assembly protein PilM [Alicyclobacillus macrosporangiidus]
MAGYLWRRSRVGVEFTRHGCRLAVLGGGRRKVTAALETAWDGQDPPDAVPEALGAFVRRHRLRKRRVIVGVPADHVTVRLLQLPPLPDKELRRAVELEIGETVMLPFDDPVFDVVRVPPIAVTGGDTGPALVVAAPRSYVERALNFVRSAGFIPSAVDIAPLARLRAAGAAAWKTPGVRVLVQVEEQETTIGIVSRGCLYFLRTVEHSTEADAPVSWADRMTDVAYEVERVTQFFQFNLASRETPVEGVWLAGAAAANPEALGQFEALLGLPVEPLAVDVQGGRSVAGISPEIYATAAGLALKGSSR